MYIQTQSNVEMQKYLKNCKMIESNCELLTVVRHNINEDDINKNQLLTFKAYIQQKSFKIDQQSLIKLIIQLTYLIFSCKHSKTRFSINQSDIRMQQIISRSNQKKYRPIAYYTLSGKTTQPFESVNILVQLIEFLLNGYNIYRNNFINEINSLEKQFQEYLYNFEKQYRYLKNNIIKFELLKEKQFFICLQQTNLFNQYSLLLKIKNNSLLNIIRQNQINFILFKKYKQIDISLVNQYNKYYKNHLIDKTRNIQKQIQINISNFFKEMSQEILTQQRGSYKDRQIYRVKLSVLIKHHQIKSFFSAVHSIMKDLPLIIEEEGGEHETNKIKSHQAQYIIQYSSERNSICIRLLTNCVKIDIQSFDYLAFQSGLLNFGRSNVKIELADSSFSELQQKSKKVIAFKGTSSFNKKQPPLQKIVLLMDIILITAKIYEPELTSSRSVQSIAKDHQRLLNINRKVTHYVKLFMKCSKKVYAE